MSYFWFLFFWNRFRYNLTLIFVDFLLFFGRVNLTYINIFLISLGNSWKRVFFNFIEKLFLFLLSWSKTSNFRLLLFYFLNYWLFKCFIWRLDFLVNIINTCGVYLFRNQRWNHLSSFYNRQFNLERHLSIYLGVFRFFLLSYYLRILSLKMLYLLNSWIFFFYWLSYWKI